MIRIGITGGIGSGKTFVSHLVEERGFPVYGCDERAKLLMQEDPVIRQKLTALLGPEIYDRSGRLDKKRMASYLFASKEHAAVIASIVHPVVRQDFLNHAHSWQQQGKTACFMESAILIESGFQDLVDFVVCITAPEELRVARAMKRDHADREAVLARVRSQISEEQRQQYAFDYVLDNGLQQDICDAVTRMLSFFKLF